MNLIVDWGDVPTWLSAIVTSGTLLLGLALLWSEHQRRVWAQARRVVISCMASVCDVEECRKSYLEMVVSASNCSGGPIFIPYVNCPKTGEYAKQVDEDYFDRNQALSDGHTLEFCHPVPAGGYLNRG